MATLDEERGGSERSFTLSTGQYLNKLHDLWTSQTLCDAKVIAENKEFKVHRVVLAAASKYFERVFSSCSWLETVTGEVHLSGISACSMDILFKSVYSQVLLLSADTVLGVLEAAHRLEFSEVFDCCESYIEEIIASDTCLEYLWAGETYNMPAVLLAAEKCLLENFTAVSKQPKFLEMDCSAVQNFLKKNNLKCENELDVFKAVVCWISHAEDRKEKTKQLMENVRFGLIPLHDLLETVWKESVMSEQGCQEMLRKAIQYNSNKYDKPFISEQWCKPRCTRDLLVIIGGYFDHALNPPPLAVPFEKPKSKNCPLLAQLKPFSDNYKSGASGVQINQYLYIIGGYYYYPSSSTTFSSREMVSNVVWRFDSVGEVCDQMTGMLVARKDHTSFLYNQFIIVAGGKNDEKKNMNSTEIYNIPENRWEVGEYLPESVIHLAGCSHKGRAYVSGGQTVKNNRDCSSRKLYKFDTVLGEWIEKASMMDERCEHVMTSTSSGLLVVGGIRVTGNSRSRNTTTIQHCHYPEMYNSQQNQWTIIRIQITIAKPACIVKEEKVYLLGGVEYVDNAANGYRLSSIMCLNSDSKTIVEMDAKLPFHIEDAIMTLMPMHVELEAAGEENDHSDQESYSSNWTHSPRSFGTPAPVSDDEAGWREGIYNSPAYSHDY